MCPSPLMRSRDVKCKTPTRVPKIASDRCQEQKARREDFRARARPRDRRSRKHVLFFCSVGPTCLHRCSAACLLCASLASTLWYLCLCIICSLTRITNIYSTDCCTPHSKVLRYSVGKRPNNFATMRCLLLGTLVPFAPLSNYALPRS